MNSIKRTAPFIILLVIILSSCTSMQTEAAPLSGPSAVGTPVRSTPVPPSATVTKTIHPTVTRYLTSTRANTPTPFPTFPPSTPEHVGTDVASAAEEISSENIHRLAHVARWGKGMILGTAFTPDGSRFVVGSAFGLAVYDIDDLQTIPVWIPFDTPIEYVGLTFSQDGRYLRLDKKGTQSAYHDDKGSYDILNFPTGQPVKEAGTQNWINHLSMQDDYGDITINSADGTKQLKAHIAYEPNRYDIEYSIREVYDLQSKELVYELPDETFYVTYNDTHQPESCDQESTAVCGNAYIPVAFAPYTGSFSPTNDTFTLLYRAPGYANYNRFSVLRIYDAKTGTILGMVGNFDDPVQTFSYSPDGSRLLVAYVDGSIHLWDIRGKQSLFGARHFNDSLRLVEFTGDDQYLVLWRTDALEFRSTENGALRSRYEMVAYSLSPADDNLVAIAGKDHVIRIVEIDSARTILRIPAHEYPIFAIQFSPDGRYIVSSGQDCKVKLWDAKTGEFLHLFEETRADPYEGEPVFASWGYPGSRIFIYSFYFIEGTNRLMGFGSWGTMVNWDIDSGAANYAVYSAPLEFYRGMMTVNPHYPTSFHVDPHLQRFYIHDTVYDLQTGQVIEAPVPESIPVPEDCSRYGLLSADGSLKFTLGYEKRDGQICVLDAQDSRLMQIITSIPDPGYDLYVAGIRLSHDGKTLIIAGKMGTVDLYRIIR